MKVLEIPQDLKYWYAISCPVKGLRFDARTLELLDTNHDGNIRTEEVVAAIEYLKGKGVEVKALFERQAADEKALAEVLAKAAALEKLEPSKEEQAAFAAWQAKGAEVAIKDGQGAAIDMAAAEAALKAVEPIVDGFFTPPEDMPLVTEEPDKTLPLKDRLNPKHLEAILAFAEKCVKPVLGERLELTRTEWKKVKAAFEPYRAWVVAKPVMNASAKAKLEDEERLLRYKLNLGEFLNNYVTMDRLYSGEGYATFQTGILRIDGKEMNLCFHVASEAAHSALSGKSNCCVVYLKLTRTEEAAERNICAVVTAGSVAGLYVGRNGVFYDRDGKNWQAVITKVVENQVSLVEAFWAPWKKLGDAVADTVKKFLGDKQAKAVANVQKGTESAQAGGAAMASSIAAVGIGVGMAGAAAASILAAVKGMGPVQLLASIAALILVVSLPSVILTWFKLRKRDLGAILNASGWAVNREMRFSTARARGFTKCARGPLWWLWLLLIIVVLAGVCYVANCKSCCQQGCNEADNNKAAVTVEEVQK